MTSARRTVPRPTLVPFIALALGVTVIGAAGKSHAAIYVSASQANTKINANDGQCSLYEAIDAINSGMIHEGDSKNGCVQVPADEIWPAIILEGNGTHYNTFGAVITAPVYIYAGNPNWFAYLESDGTAPVLTNRAGTQVGGDYTKQTTLWGVTIQHTGTGPGRVIENSGFLWLDTVTVKGGNVLANTGTAAYGGGVYNTGEVVIHGSNITSNKAKRGGGIYSDQGDGVDIEKSSITRNYASEHGGGAFTRTRFLVSVVGQSVTISDNTADGKGGGLYCDHGPGAYCALFHVTVSNNKAAQGGGVYRPADANPCVPSEPLSVCNISDLRRSIVANNKNTQNQLDDFFGDPHHDDLGATAEYASLFSSFLGTENHVGDFIGNPNLGPLQKNFGSITESRALIQPSDALDRPTSFPYQCPDTDQNFQWRPSLNLCDLGAYENNEPRISFFEAESLNNSTNGAVASVATDAKASGGKWSQLAATKDGDFIDYTLSGIAPGTYQVKMQWKGNANRGKLSMKVDGNLLGQTLDQYSSGETYPTTTFGTVSFTTTGSHTIRLTVVGKNASSSGRYLSADRFMLTLQP